MRASRLELSDLIATVYEAGLDPTGTMWPAVLDRLSSITGGAGAVLGIRRDRYAYAQVHCVGVDETSMREYQTYYGGIDPVLEWRMPTAHVGALLRSDLLISSRELERTEFYTDWLRPRDIGVGLATVLLRHGSMEAGLYSARPRRSGTYSARDLEDLGLILPHIAAAVRASLRLVEIGAPGRAAADALDHWRQAVFLVDHRSRLHASNRAAESLLRASDGLSLQADRGGAGGRLLGATPDATCALRRLIAAAAAIATPLAIRHRGGPSPEGSRIAMALSRPSGRPALTALVVPLCSKGDASLGWAEALAAEAPHATVAVFVTDPAAGDEPDMSVSERLRVVYRLTPAEAVVAVALASGDGLLAVAATQHVSIATVRSQAQCAFRKTGVRGQAALARLVERLAQVR